MNPIWPMDLYGTEKTKVKSKSTVDDKNGSAQGTESNNQINTTKVELLDLCRLAPKLLNKSEYTIGNKRIGAELNSVYAYMRKMVGKCTTIENVADLCLSLCRPYRYPCPDSAQETDRAYYEYTLGNVFREQDFTRASLDYLVLQYLYRYQPITVDNRLQAKINHVTHTIKEQIKGVQKATSNRSMQYTNNPHYLTNAIKMDNPKSFASLYDLIIAGGLKSTTAKWNPYAVNFMTNKVNSNYWIENVIEPNDLVKFLSRFHLQNLFPWSQDHNFRSVSNYIVERITNINLINRLHKIYLDNMVDDTNHPIPLPKKPFSRGTMPQKWITIPGFFFFATYPLVSYRLKLLRQLCKQKDSLEYKLSFEGNVITTNPGCERIRMDMLQNTILFHSTFYFPLLTKLFHLLLSVKKIEEGEHSLSGLIKENDGFALKHDMCSLFTSELSDSTKEEYEIKPIEPLPGKDEALVSITIPWAPSGTGKAKTKMPIYHYIQFFVSVFFDEQARRLQRNGFLDTGFKCREPLSRFADNIMKETDFSISNKSMYEQKDGENSFSILQPFKREEIAMEANPLYLSFYTGANL